MVENFVSDEKFYLDGVSSDELNLFVAYLPPMPMAEQRYTEYKTGADEGYTTPDDVYNDITYTIKFYTFLNDDYNDTAIKDFCANKKLLSLSRFPGFNFKIRKIKLNASDGGYGKRIDYILQLTIAPFRYMTDNPLVQAENGAYIHNPGTRYSKPIFEIIGTGDIELFVNGASFTVKGLAENQSIIIDSSRYITYSGNTLLTGVTDGKYPMFNIHDNIISWTGDVASVKYRGNWRCY